jgi:glycosyltransferase involved in cell wall biosynthesis
LRKRATRSRESVRRQLDVRDDQALVLMVGNIREWKGQREVIKALSLLPKRILAQMRLLFVGAIGTSDVDYATELESLVSANSLEDCVTFLGARSDVPDLFRAADIAVHASTTPEPFGLVVPEAMALGCAVVATSFGGPAEVITPGTGLLCDPTHPEQYADALRTLVTDAPLRSAIADAGSERAALFGIERNVAGTMAAYQQLLNPEAAAFSIV